MEKKTQRPFQNPLWFCLRFLFSVSLYGTQHISENSLLGEGGVGVGEWRGRSEKNAAPNVAAPPTGKDNEHIHKASVYEASLSQCILTYTSNSSCAVSSSRQEAEQTNKTTPIIEWPF